MIADDGLAEPAHVKIKRRDLGKTADYRDALRAKPDLVWLFFELTRRCNMSCLHCGSSCSPQLDANLDFDAAKRVLVQVAERYGASNVMIALTGGEPLLYPRFFEFASLIKELGFGYGITTNGSLITHSCGEALRQSGLASVSVSLDGMRDLNNWFRNTPDAFERATLGIKELVKTNPRAQIQVTTVVHKQNIDHLDELCDYVATLGVGSWRLVNIEPIGRAQSRKDLMLESSDYKRLFDFIQLKRFSADLEMEVTYGCSHYLGIDREHMLRDTYFLCGAGLFVASVTASGDISACLDIERSPELIQGNIFHDDFIQVWENGFKQYRLDRSASSEYCRDCPHARFCAGDSAHTWDFEKRAPRLCLNNALA
jgi:radical SAM protein with 4Fe4S-binding SPASM domain